MSESKSSNQMSKVEPAEEYPTKPGCYLQGNHYSPVAMVIALNAPYGSVPPKVKAIPPEVEKL